MATNADGSVIIEVDLSVSEAQKELNKLQKNIERTESELNKKETSEDAIARQFEAARKEVMATEKAVDSLQRKLEETDRVLSFGQTGADVSPEAFISAQTARPQIAAELAEQQKKLKASTAEMNKLAAAGEKLSNEITEGATGLEDMKNRAGALARHIAQTEHSASGMDEATKRAAKNAETFRNRLKAVVRSALIFTVVTQALARFREWMGKVIETNAEAQEAFGRLKGALLTMIQPLINVVVPALIWFVNVLSTVVSYMAQLTSWMFGSTVDASKEAASALYDQTKALGATGAAAKKAEKSLASFDEINRLSSEESGGGGGAGGTTVAPNFEGLMQSALSGLTSMLTGLALIAIGAVLTFTGASIPVGLAMMVAGGLMTYHAIATDPSLAAALVESSMGAVLALVSAGLLVIGAVLAFSGANVPLGIGLMVAGAAGLAAMAAVNWDSIVGYIADNFNSILAVASGALLAIGLILALSGVNLPLGIGLMAAGAIGLTASAALNWEALKKQLQGTTGEIVALVSAALLAVGAVLAFSGANIPLGIGLMAAGAVGLAATAAVNWDTIRRAMEGPIGKITMLVSGGLLALGAILLLTGANVPLGLGLLAAGGVGLVASIGPNWNWLVDGLKNAWKRVKDWWKQNVAFYFSGAFWAEVGRNFMNGLIGEIETGLNAVLGGAGRWVNRIIKVLNMIPGVEIGSVSWGNIQLPRLAQGAVIPPNSEFLAILGDQKRGTNIEAPLDTIVEAFNRALEANGGGSAGPIHVTLQVDKTKLGTVVIDAINTRTRAANKTLLYL